MSEEGKRFADATNDELRAIIEGRMWTDSEGNHIQGSYEEMQMKYGADFEDEYEPYYLGEWISDSVYDVRYVVEADKSFRSVMLMLAGGGPTVWLSTESEMIEFSWGGEPTEYYPVTYGVCDELDEYARDAMF